MTSKKMEIQDESGDKKYFTIIPNYILNHSTIYDREVYIQMKKIAGEEGTCWTSRNTLAKKCGISERRLDKSIIYLLEHKWIKKVGTKKIPTKGGFQEVNEYKIVDLWKMNTDFYIDKGVAPETTPYDKGIAQNSQRGSTDEAKGIAPGADKEEPYINKNPINNSKAVALQVSDLISSFKEINIDYDSWYKNTTQRKAIESLIEKVGIDRLKTIINLLPKTNKLAYVTTITTPQQLLKDFSKLESQLIKLKNNKIKRVTNI